MITDNDVKQIPKPGHLPTPVVVGRGIGLISLVTMGIECP